MMLFNKIGYLKRLVSLALAAAIVLFGLCLGKVNAETFEIIEIKSEPVVQENGTVLIDLVKLEDVKQYKLIVIDNPNEFIKSQSADKYVYPLPDGNYTVMVIGFDTENSIVAKSLGMAVKVNSKGPQIETEVTSMTAAGIDAHATEIKRLEDGAILPQNIRLDVHLTDGNGFSFTPYVRIWIDGKETEMVTIEEVTNKFATVSTNISFKEGFHTIEIQAYDKEGQSTIIKYSDLKTYSGPAKVVSSMICYPNPFSPANGEETTFKYELSADADIEVMVFDITGKRIWKNNYPAGSPGGRAGENKVRWDGRSLSGEFPANGPYPWFVVSQGKRLSRSEVVILNR